MSRPRSNGKKPVYPCTYCGEPVFAREQHEDFPHAMHVECGLRAVMGSLAHIERRCGCYVKGSTETDPPGLTVRQAAKMAYNAYRKLHLGER